MPTTKKKNQDAVIVWIRNHPFASISILIHCVLIVVALNNLDYFKPAAATVRERQMAESYTRESRKEAMRERVNDMEFTKQRLEELLGESLGETESAFQNDQSKSIEQLYEESEALIEEIKAQSEAVLAEKLSALEESQIDSADDKFVDEDKEELEKSDEENKDRSEKDSEDQDSNEFSVPDLSGDIKLAMPKSGQGGSEGDGSEGDGSGGGSITGFSDAEMLQRTTMNQMQAREILEKIERSERAKTEGHALSGNGSYDASNPMSIESHFNLIAQGENKDLSAEMRELYSVQNNTDPIVEETNNSSVPRLAGHVRFNYSRKLQESAGAVADWVALDAWYFIGPFPNPGRVNLHTRFPPEIKINLDAVYLGDSDRLLRWEYIEFSHLPIIPPDFTDYAVYYATTEVNSDRNRDVWLAIGADDQSKLWVNNILVWKSDDRERVWEMNQGFRKIHLKKGNNTFLFRLENGIERAAFSVTLKSTSK